MSQLNSARKATRVRDIPRPAQPPRQNALFHREMRRTFASMTNVERASFFRSPLAEVRRHVDGQRGELTRRLAIG